MLDMPPLPPGLAPLPNQVVALRFALTRLRSYLGLDPGLGKTIVAALLARALSPWQRVVYICPPALVLNVLSEFTRWGAARRAYVFSDTQLQHPEVTQWIRRLATRGVVSTLIVDEAHRFKTATATRTLALFGGKGEPGIAPAFARQVYMSGTPMPNRPIELYPLLSKAAPWVIDCMPMHAYGVRFCGAYRNRWGWQYTGATRLWELRARVIAPRGSFMLRQRKELLKLPPKLEEIFVVSSTMSSYLAALDTLLSVKYSKVEDLIGHHLAAARGLAPDELGTPVYRRLLGVEKVPAAVDFVETILEESTESVILFGYHKEVIEGLRAGLAKWKPFVVDGSTKKAERFRAVNDFQGGDRRLVIGNYIALGLGFTLTKATRVVFAEYSWTPGENDQASDRAHRIGQTETVLVQYLVYENSLDKKVLETLIRKRKITQFI